MVIYVTSTHKIFNEGPLSSLVLKITEKTVNNKKWEFWRKTMKISNNVKKAHTYTVWCPAQKLSSKYLLSLQNTFKHHWYKWADAKTSAWLMILMTKKIITKHDSSVLASTVWCPTVCWSMRLDHFVHNSMNNDCNIILCTMLLFVIFHNHLICLTLC